ncbi:MAG: TonB family protein [Venatoribacter sp.]
MSWLSPRHYSVPVVLSSMLHAVVLALLFWQWTSDKNITIEPVPEHVIAEVIQVESAAEKQRKQEEAKQRQREAAAKRAAEQKRQQELKKQREQEQAAAKKRQEELKKQQEIKQKAEAEQRLKDQQERERLEKQRKAQAEQQRAEEQRRQEQALQEQLKREREEAQRKAQEDARQKAQEEARKQAERAASITADYVTQIRAQVSSVWRYPSTVRPEQKVKVAIRLVPTGEVVQVHILQGSGNIALDRSVEQAIHKASPLPVPDDIRIFEQQFRNLTMEFRPENASW